jgi:hypothetical protein
MRTNRMNWILPELEMRAIHCLCLSASQWDIKELKKGPIEEGCAFLIR